MRPANPTLTSPDASVRSPAPAMPACAAFCRPRRCTATSPLPWQLQPQIAPTQHTQNSAHAASQPRNKLARCISEVSGACAARLCRVLPPQALHCHQPAAIAAANAECTHAAHAKQRPCGQPTPRRPRPMSQHSCRRLRCPPVPRSAALASHRRQPLPAPRLQLQDF